MHKKKNYGKSIDIITTGHVEKKINKDITKKGIGNALSYFGCCSFLPQYKNMCHILISILNCA